jgi:hypothetical protein
MTITADDCARVFEPGERLYLRPGDVEPGSYIGFLPDSDSTPFCRLDIRGIPGLHYVALGGVAILDAGGSEHGLYNGGFILDGTNVPGIQCSLVLRGGMLHVRDREGTNNATSNVKITNVAFLHDNLDHLAITLTPRAGHVMDNVLVENCLFEARVPLYAGVPIHKYNGQRLSNIVFRRNRVVRCVDGPQFKGADNFICEYNVIERVLTSLSSAAEGGIVIARHTGAGIVWGNQVLFSEGNGVHVMVVDSSVTGNAVVLVADNLLLDSGSGGRHTDAVHARRPIRAIHNTIVGAARRGIHLARGVGRAEFYGNAIMDCGDAALHYTASETIIDEYSVEAVLSDFVDDYRPAPDGRLVGKPRHQNVLTDLAGDERQDPTAAGCYEVVVPEGPQRLPPGHYVAIGPVVLPAGVEFEVRDGN